MVDAAQLQLWVDEARGARHAVMTGRSVIDVWVMEYGRTRYSTATLAELNGYISALEAEIAQLAQPIVRARGPIRLIWP